jgi:two-component system, chemotaxis family, chemotaxis protein CheY
MQGLSRTLLIVDDSGACAETLELALEGLAGLSIVVVNSAEDALVALVHESVAGLVTDLHLPRMSGLELVGVVRGLPGKALLPILVVSGDSDPRTPSRALEAGANAFFAKPYSPAAVRRQLEGLLNEGNGRTENGRKT